jgi:hypothetical protein
MRAARIGHFTGSARYVSPNWTHAHPFHPDPTSHAGNVGAAARAMKVMGFDDLVLVQAALGRRAGRDETIERASGAVDVLRKARASSTRWTRRWTA